MQNDNSEFPNEFYGSLSEIRRFEGLQSLALSFHPDCAGPDDSRPHTDVEADVEFRFTIMQRVLSVLTDRVMSRNSLQSLSIDCLQGYVDPRIVDKPTFRMLLQGLSSLSLNVVRELDIIDPERSLYYPEIHTFYEQMPTIWLQPALKILTTLSLFGSDFWGWSPKVDFRGLHFPNLKVLALGHFTFSHDWQADWIASHGQTLLELYLDDCPIIHATCTSYSLDQEGYLVPNETKRSNEALHQIPTWTCYGTRWNHLYKKWSKHMQKLLVLKIGTCDGVKQPSLEYRAMSEAQVYLHQYTMFNTNFAPSQWLRCSGDFSNHVYRYSGINSQEADDEALLSLWRQIDVRTGIEPRSRIDDYLE